MRALDWAPLPMTAPALRKSLPPLVWPLTLTEEPASQSLVVAPLPSAPLLELRGVSKHYGSGQRQTRLLDDINLQVTAGEFVAIVGYSGSGKTTLISLMASLIAPTSGRILKEGKALAGPGPDRGIVFQAPSLVPWMTAFENVLLGIAQVYPHAVTSEQQQIAIYYLTRVGLREAMHKRPAELSKGMQQRVGIARAFALQPKLLLLDEPFGMLDSLTRWELQEVLMEVWSRNQLTAICVTHDIDEALLLSDRVVMMTNGPKPRVGGILKVDLPRHRSRRALLDHPDYYRLREELLEFLISCDHP